MAAVLRAGEEFREDLRAPGARNAQARRLLTPAELAPLTQLSTPRSLLAIAQTFGLIAAAIALALLTWPSAWIVPAVAAIGIAQHGLFILAHEAAHYRLFANRTANDLVGRAVGMTGGVSMCTYRVTHRLHHNNLYSEEDPDTAIHGGYPRGRGYLLDKLLRDLAGLNAWKTFAYFFGAPAINADTQRAIRPLDDTSPSCALTVLQPVLRLRAILEHGAVEDLGSPLTAARTNRTWGAPLNLLARATLFPHHVNYHLEHHLYPAVPHYHLPRLHRILRDKGALEAAEVRDVRDTWNLVYSERRRRD